MKIPSIQVSVSFMLAKKYMGLRVYAKQNFCCDPVLRLSTEKKKRKMKYTFDDGQRFFFLAYAEKKNNTAFVKPLCMVDDT